ncbi:NAD(P)/FAD-dependent oxidoreductase [Ketobacter sp.]|uniref:NAD(P)/FAD-dependent oxidoreductase n=1 Tax=Ketobacter sp. TaxID=2083498 RepID=UPI000F2D653A|nr:NAD(P)/FAD-dependent oxidoreductase [Ketobacter sp.]RLT92147.1 MAG: NAD(P)/FAD-dependent oxidoreductase [Ketobacter sp.]
MDHFDCCVIGAGVVGLAIGRALTQAGKSTLVLEQATCVGSGISSRNSEVIHAGLYYPRDSLKARLCVQGKAQLYAYCAQRGIAHRRLGKLVVATSTRQEDALSDLQARAETNGVTDLAWISAKRLRVLEPNLRAKHALMSPSTGIIDSHGLMQALTQDLEAGPGLLSLQTELLAATRHGNGYQLELNSVGERYRCRCDVLINAAGLSAQTVATRIEDGSPQPLPQLHLCRGNYFAYPGRAPFSHLIYPLPEADGSGLGIHATLDLSGQVRFGPDVEYLSEEDYRVDETKRSHFVNAIQRYFPGLDPGRLTPAYCGIRPKLQGPGQPPADFHIQHGPQGLIHLFGIESPGLTASLAIAEHVTGLVS